jgi:amino acid adenylation domain-containing protein
LTAAATVTELLEDVSRRGVTLWVEGGKLRFRAPKGALLEEHRAAFATRRSEVITALRAQAAGNVRFAPLSYNQRALWFVAQEAEASAAYNIAATARVRTKVDAGALRDALQGLTDRHAMLRTTYTLGDDGLPVQRTVGWVEVAFDVHDVRNIGDGELLERVSADYRRPIDLERGPVFRASLYARAPDDHVFLMVVHHIAADAWSMGVMVDDLQSLSAEAGGLPAKVTAPPEREYTDFVDWQARMLEAPEGTGLAQYWSTRLAPPRTHLELPADKPRPPKKTFRGATLTTTAGPDLLDGVRKIAREDSTTLFVVLLAAYYSMLHRLTGEEDLVVGTPTASRPGAEFSKVVGYFVNPVPLRTRVHPTMTFRELVSIARTTASEALDGQDYPLPLMVQHSRTARDPGRSPLFEVFFSALSAEQIRSAGTGDDAPADAPKALTGPYPLTQLEGQFDLALQVIEYKTKLDIELRYSTDLFEKVTAERYLSHFVGLLESAARNVDCPIEDLSSVVSAKTSNAPAEALLAELAARDVRVKLDGDKLRLSAPSGAVDDELKARLASQKTELIEVLRSARVERRPVARGVPFTLPSAQQKVWLRSRRTPGALLNVGISLRMRGRLNQAALTRALDALVRRHESFRLCIRETDGRARAEPRSDVTPKLDVLDIAAADGSARRAEALRALSERTCLPFDLGRGPLARFVLARLSLDEHLLLIAMPRIAADEWSLRVAVRDLAAFYDAEVGGMPPVLQPLEMGYADFAAWQHDRLSGGLYARHLSYWRRQLAGAPAALELPTDRPRPPVQSFRARRRSCRMPREQLDALNDFGRAHDATLYVTLLTAFQVLLSRYSGQEDLVVGCSVPNRERQELEASIGAFANDVALRGRLEGNPSVSQFLTQVKGTVKGALAYAEVPFDRLTEALRPETSESHHDVFQTRLTLSSSPALPSKLTGLEMENAEEGETEGGSQYDLALEVEEHEGGLRMVYEYAADLFDSATIARMHAQYLTLLGQIVMDASQTVRDIPLMTDEEGANLLSLVNATVASHDRSMCVLDLVRATARQHPDDVAVEASGVTLTYAALEQRARQVAHLLRAQGVGRGSLVGVCLDRTWQLPVALLGVLEAGAAYVPVDPAHPAERLSYTLRDAGVACVVTDARFGALLSGAEVPLVLLGASPSELDDQPADAPNVALAPSDLAYVIYTSGSTGRPKGVEIEHGNFVNFLRSMQKEPGLRRGDVLLAVTTPSFDIAGLELFLPLTVGAKTVIASRGDVLDGERLRERIESCGATMLQATPATWRLLIDAGWQGKADLTALCGGEALPRDLAKELSSRVRALFNMYGPTETTVWSTVHRVVDCERDIPIGHPIANTNVYVLDASGRPAPVGVAGELCIGGEGVARGYRQRPELTAEKFAVVKPPGRAPERVYRTGDVVRLRADLALEFVGRRDHQVKLRGYRIELGEIEAVLADQPAVRRSVVIVREDIPGDPRLVAYVVPKDEGVIPMEELRAALRARLPEYMVPSLIVPLASLPLTANDKIDRKALPVPQTARASAATDDTIMTEPQRRVAAIWCSVLKLERVGLYENFFDIGGHSLLVIKVHTLLRREFGVELTVVDLFQRTTVAGQAELVSLSGERDAGLSRARARAARQAESSVEGSQ